MLTLNDGRSELWQWDTGRTLAVDADCSQVHFSNKVFGRSIDVDVIDGTAIIPDILLQTDKELNVWAFVGTAENGYTKISKTFKVNRRNKPADYVFTPPEQTTLAELSGRLDRIEESQDQDAIKNAVDEYLKQNPVEVPVQSVNGQIGAVELTAENVGAISQGDLQTATNEALAQAKASGEFDGADGKSAYAYAVEGGYTGTETEFAEKLAQDIPTTLPNPNAITFTGAVTGSYDGSAAVTVDIPSGGGGNVSVAIKAMDGYKIAPTGTLLVDTAGTQFVSAPIPVTAGEKLRITASAKYGNSLYALYDASGAMVDNQTAAATAEGTAVEEMSVTVHADAVTLRVAWDKAVTDTAYAVIRVGGQTEPDGPLVGVKCAVIGDSVIEAAAAPNAGLVELMAASTGAEITNLGVGGTGWMRGKEDGTAYYQRVDDIPADTQRVLLYGSGNDRELTLGDPADTGTETVCGCVNATLDAVYAHVPTAWVGIIAPAPWQHYPPYESGNAMELLANALGAICRRRGVPYLDLYHSSGLRPWDDAFRELAYNNADGIHPNDTGYGMIAPQCSAFLVGGGTAQKLAAEMPDKLPNPNALTFTGAVDGSYDGSAPLEVNIPQGGGGAWHTIGTQKMDGVETAVSFDLNGETIIQIIVTANWNAALTATKATVILTFESGETVQFTPQTMNATHFAPKNIFTIFGNSKHCRQMIFSKAEGAVYSNVEGSFGVAYWYSSNSEYMVEDGIATGITITFEQAPSNAAIVKVEGM